MVETATQATLRVPREHVEALRLGVLRELEFDGDWIKDQADEARRSREGDEKKFPRKPRLDADPFDWLRGPLQETQHDAEVLRQLGNGRARRAVIVKGEATSLKHSLEATARYLSAELAQSEFGGGGSDPAVATVSWAIAEAKRLAEEALPNLERGKQGCEEVELEAVKA